MSSIGIPGLILILILALVLFGPKKLPELGRAVGHTLKEFKHATRGLTKDDDEDEAPRGQQIQAATTTTTAPAATQVETVDRAQLEKEIRERIERERLEAEIREKMQKEAQHS